MNSAPLDVPTTGGVPAPTPGTRRQIAAWATWDWGSAAFNAVMTTFVFSAYLVSDSFGTEAHTSLVIGITTGIAGLFIALLAPASGQRADHSGKRRFRLGLHSMAIVVIMALCFFVRPAPEYLLLGAGLLAVGHIFSELAGVNYNAMLLQISTPKTIGRISGIGWASGYLGGIVLLLVVYFGFVKPDVGWFGITHQDGMNVRIVALVAAVWFFLSALPVLTAIPENKADPTRPKVGFLQSYVLLWETLKRLRGSSPQTLLFLISSAIFRDGLAAVFAFGAIIAKGSFGFSAGDVIIFGVAANVVAAVGAIAAGFIEDKVGPKAIIAVSLVGLIVSGTTVMFLHGATAFWIFGLLLSLFVGPAQSSARTFLARLAPSGSEGELFGLYATTGRAVSFLSPLLFSLCIALCGAQRWGIIGIVVILAIGLATLAPLKSPRGHVSSQLPG